MYMIPKMVHAAIGGLFFINYFDLLNRFELYKSNKGEAIISPVAWIDEVNREGFCPIHLAVKSDNFEAVFTLIESFGANINARSVEQAYTPLILAIKQNNYEIFHYLLSKDGIDVNLATDDLKTPLHFASEQNSVEMIESLLKKGARVDYMRGSRHSPFHLAVRSGKLAAARFFGSQLMGIGHCCLHSKAPLESSLHFLSRQLLPVEVWMQMFEIVILAMSKNVLDSGLYASIIERRSLTGQTPLQLAIEEENESAVAGLVVSGANIETIFQNHFSILVDPLIQTVYEFFGSNAKFLPSHVNAVNNENVWHLAARAASIPFIRCIAMKYPEIRSKIHDVNCDGLLPVELALQLKCYDPAVELIRLHDHVIPIENLEKLMHSSVLECQFLFLRTLLQEFTPEFKVIASSHSCGSLLHLMITVFPYENPLFDSDVYVEFLVLLLKHCPNLLSLRDSLGRTPIDLAIQRDNFEFLNLLPLVSQEVPELEFNASSSGSGKNYLII
jgi:ankyrin repeat protein